MGWLCMQKGIKAVKIWLTGRCAWLWHPLTALLPRCSGKPNEGTWQAFSLHRIQPGHLLTNSGFHSHLTGSGREIQWSCFLPVGSVEKATDIISNQIKVSGNSTRGLKILDLPQRMKREDQRESQSTSVLRLFSHSGEGSLICLIVREKKNYSKVHQLIICDK